MLTRVMTSIEIEYCVPCGLRERAVDVQEALLNEYGERLDRVALVTGDNGVFEVRVGDDLVYDKETDDYDVDDIVANVREYVKAPA